MFDMELLSVLRTLKEMVGAPSNTKLLELILTEVGCPQPRVQNPIELYIHSSNESAYITLLHPTNGYLLPPNELTLTESDERMLRSLHRALRPKLMFRDIPLPNSIAPLITALYYANLIASNPPRQKHAKLKGKVRVYLDDRKLVFVLG